MILSEFSGRLDEYKAELIEQEKAKATIKAYTEDTKVFIDYMIGSGATDNTELTKADILRYKQYLIDSNRTTATINRYIVTLNRYIAWIDAPELLGTKQLKVQQKTDLDNVLSTSEYERLLNAAINPGEQARKAGLKPDMQAWVCMQMLANTGVRWFELQFFTVESINAAPKNGYAITVTNKGKQRNVPISKELYKLLKEYCAEQGITTGYIIGTKNGNPMLNEQMHRKLKRIAGYARVNKSKVHPHNFRHLFGKVYMQEIGRIDELADILGHSNLSTTRIYSRTTSKEKAANISKLGLLNAKPKTKKGQ